MEIRRQYQPHEVNWILIPDLLKKYLESIPENEFTEDSDKLLALPRFEVSTFSQGVEMDMPEVRY